ncbi:MAG TPA: 50S ribosomal protein L30 [Candidatus Norongarragalinales archaeon]|jgi:large subunit ribosomal protein L30|nr:50S ribosomal protein L30 [Candidatus Norongarragalinales archaeon]
MTPTTHAAATHATTHHAATAHHAAGAWIVVRVRGSYGVRGNVADAMKQMRLRRRNSAAVIANKVGSIGMLRKVRGYVTWGPATKESITFLLQKRGLVEGGKPVTDDFIKKHSKIAGIDALATGVAEGKMALKDVDGLQPLFRLNSPKGGYEATKHNYPDGALGDRKEAIFELVQRMV